MGSGGSSVDYESSPEQRQLLSSIMPLVQGLANYGTGNMTMTPTGNPLPAGMPMNTPTGTLTDPVASPSTGYTGGNTMRYGGSVKDEYDNMDNWGRGQAPVTTAKNYIQPEVNQYTGQQVTSLFNAPSAPMPTSGWYNNIAPEVMKGLWEPYNDAAGQMAETLNMQGSLGGGGQYTGNAMGNFGDFYSKAGTEIGTQAWNLMSPGMTQDYNTQLQQLMMPYQLMGMTPSLMPTGVVSNEPNTGGNMLMGAGSGALAGATVGGPYGAIIGGVGGALAGLMSG